MTLLSCKACPLWETARQVVPGEGPQPAEYLFLAEAPGGTEDMKGRPLVGESGRLFDRLLVEAGLDRADVFVDNVVRHRPPKNRTPYAKEIKACSAWTLEMLEKVRPRVVVTMGATALRWVDKGLGLKAEHGKARLCVLEGREIVLVPWYHPAAALRDPRLVEVMARDAERLVEEVEGFGEKGKSDYHLAQEKEMAILAGGTVVGFDTETTSPKRGGVFQTDEAEMVGYSFSMEPRTGFYVEVKSG